MSTRRHDIDNEPSLPQYELTIELELQRLESELRRFETAFRELKCRVLIERQKRAILDAVSDR